MATKTVKKRAVLISLAVLTVIIAGLAILRLNGDNGGLPARHDGPVNYSTDKPDEKKPDYIPKAGPGEPKRLSLPSIGAEGYVQKVGVDQNKQVAVPTNIHFAGWYVRSAKPGQPGLSVIDGHVDGRSNKGIFFDLKKLKPGDKYEVELGNGTIKRFRVMDVMAVDNKDSANILFSQKPSVKSQLNLITCGGNFDSKKRAYDQRIIVTSELI